MNGMRHYDVSSWLGPSHGPDPAQARQRTNRTEGRTHAAAAAFVAFVRSGSSALIYFRERILFHAPPGTMMRFSPVTLALLLFPAVAFAAVPDGLSEVSPVVRR